MTAKITSTTDGRFVGHDIQFETESREVELPGGIVVPIDRIAQHPEGYVLSGSNYIIVTTTQT